MNQEITLNLIILNQQGKPQFILEPRPQGRSLREPSPVGATRAEQNAGVSSSGESIQREPQHIGGTTLGQMMEKEQMA